MSKVAKVSDGTWTTSIPGLKGAKKLKGAELPRRIEEKGTSVELERVP